MLKIAFDGKRAFNNKSGLGNYSRFIINSLNKYFPDNEYLYYTPYNKIQDFEKNIKKEDIVLPSSFISSMVPALWRSLWLYKDVEKSGAQIYHGLSNELPLFHSSIKKVVTIHDLIFLRFPELYPFIDRAIYKKKFKTACSNADIIISISEQTKRDLINYYDIDDKKVKVIYQDCNSLYHTLIDPSQLNIIKSKYSLPPNYILCVGTLEKRKNQLTLLKAFNSLGLSDLQLVLIGKVTSYKKELEEYIYTHRLKLKVKFLSNIPIQDMPAIYQGSSILIYPSIFEGFGLPVLEGINSGVPVITSKGSCFSEAGGEGAVYVNPQDGEELAEAIRTVIENHEIRKAMVIEGRRHALKFRPEITMPQLMEVYCSLI